MNNNNSHLAALHRKRLSSTARSILKLGLISFEESFLDYGCGRGFDFQELQRLGYNATGYDPYYFPDTPLKYADVVMFSYVLNVLQDPVERKEALLRAWRLARKRLIVAAIVSGPARLGKVTSVGTFTKEWGHVELKGFIESVLGYEAVRLDKDKFLIDRNARQFTPLHYEEVLARTEAIAHQSWVPPMGVIIKGYCTDFKPRAGFDEIDTGDFPGRIRYYRLLAKTRCLPNKDGQLVRVIHIRGGKDSEMMQWAIACIKRRNQIAEMKFHCIEQSFLSEFHGTRNFDFLDTDNVKIYR